MSFFDHFTSFDTSRWASITNGSGTVTTSDGKTTCTLAGGSDAAAFVYKTRIDKTRSQLWTWCSRQSADASMRHMYLINSASQPTHDITDTLEGANALIRVSQGGISGARHIFFDYWDGSSVRTQWNDGGAAWTTSLPQSALGAVVSDDYHVFGLEIDGPGNRWRLLAWAKSSGSSYSADIGLQLWAVTEWVAWSSVRFATSTDLWLVFGWPLNDNPITCTIDYEWVRHADGATVHAWTNQKDAVASSYNIKHWWSYDGQVFVPETRAGVAIATGSGWESAQTKDKSIVRDEDGTHYMAYVGSNGSVWQIGMASNPGANDGAWTKRADNPIIATGGAGVADTSVFAPYLVKDWTDPDPDRRWKCYYTAEHGGTGAMTICLATAAHPLGTWTKRSTLLSPGTGGDFDDVGCSNAVLVRAAPDQWELWYAGTRGTAHSWQVGRATGVSPNGPFTKDGNGAVIAGQQDQVQALSANLAGRTLSLTDTTGFEADQLVCVDQDSTADNWNLSRVRKVTTNTSLELYHALQGFTTANSAEVRGLRAGAVTIHHIEYLNGEWWFYCTLFAPFGTHASFSAFLETTTIFTASTLTGTKTPQWINGPQFGFGQSGYKRSSENPALARAAIGSNPARRALPPSHRVGARR